MQGKTYNNGIITLLFGGLILQSVRAGLLGVPTAFTGYVWVSTSLEVVFAIEGCAIANFFIQPLLKKGEESMKNTLKTFWQDEEGATAIEYGLIAALIAVAIIVAFGALGEGLKGLFDDIVARFGGVNSAGE